MDARTEGGGAGAATAPAPEERPPPRRRLVRRVLPIAAVLVVAGAVLWWLHARNYEDTDDAQIGAYVSAVSSRVPGTVTEVLVQDDDRVRAGQVLVRLDPTDLEVGLAQAKAQVAQAEAAVAAQQPAISITQTSNVAAVESAAAGVDDARTALGAAQRDAEQANASARLAASDLARARQLAAGGSIAPSELDRRVAAADVARAAAAAAAQRLAGRRARLDLALTRQREVLQNAPRQLVTRQAGLEVQQANLELAQARLRQAELDLGYANVVAPADGIVGNRTVNVGDRVQPGQRLLALTQTGHFWVDANFRETQIRSMKAGQPATVHVDALGRDYRGSVEGFAGATGSRYSLLPPENAAGNWVKVVQRIAVRVRLDPGQPDLDRLRPGMSVEATVKVR